MFTKKPMVAAAIIIFAAVCYYYIRVTYNINITKEKLFKQHASVLIILRGYKGALKAQDGTWDAMRNEVELIVLREETAFKDALLKEVHFYLDGLQGKNISESDVESFVLDEEKRQISVQETKHVNKWPDELKNESQVIKNFLAELIQPKQDSQVTVGSYFTYYQPQVDYLNTLHQEDPILIDYIRNHLWIPPVPKNIPYNLGNPKQIDYTEGQWPAILDVFKNNTSAGYFIECGGLDGETSTNTLDLEMRHNWTGVLIEPSPINFGAMLKKKRKAALIPTCLSLEKHPTFVTFAQNVGIGRILNTTEKPLYSHVPVAQVHCMPFYSIYQVIGRKEIDFFVLDIEGHEVEVLHTIPFEKINILTLMIEHLNGKTYDKNYMREFMLKKNYRLYNGSKTYKWPDLNYFFIKKGSKYDVAHP